MIGGNFCFRYDHLAHCIARLLSDQPRKRQKEIFYFEIWLFFQGDGADLFEDISKNMKSEATRPQQDTLRDRPAPDTEHILAEEQKPLFDVCLLLLLLANKLSIKIENR